LPEAEEFSAKCLATANDLVARFPNVHAFQDLLSGYVKRLIGCVHEHMGRLDQAADAYRLALAGQEALLRDYPSVARYRKGAFLARCCLGEVLWAMARRPEATEAFRGAHAHGDQLDEADSIAQDQLACFLATDADPRVREPRRAVQIARRVVEQRPEQRGYWCTLGAAQYAAGDYPNAVQSLGKAVRGPYGFAGYAAIYLAMAYWQLGQTEEARAWYDRAVAQMEKRELHDVGNLRLRGEAETLLGIKTKEKGS
jgi:tetratricopeptide (TPR) repeat protein